MKYSFLLLSLLYAFGGCTPSETKTPEATPPETTVTKPQPTPQVHPTSPSELASPPVEINSLAGFEWITGTWKQQENEQTVSYETWRKESDTHYIGSSCTIQAGDTVWSEALEIVIKDNKAVYMATVPENPGPVGFTLTGNEDNRADFENPEHDFPWKITYWRKGDTLNARIAGFRDGQAAFNDLVMIKEK